eukprot:TCONS_00069961-protein
MEVFLSLGDVILYDALKNLCLWCNRSDGSFLTSTGEKFQEVWNPVLLGTVYGIIGKMQILPGSEWKLIAITGHQFVGYLPGGIEVYCITKVTLIPLTPESIDLGILELEQPTVDLNNGEKSGSQKVQQTWKYFKDSASNITNKNNNTLKEKDKTERRLVEELLKMFNDSGNFYYSPNGDITNSQQRLREIKSPYHWKQTDDRFFWNKFMLKELVESESEHASHWILPVMQGFVQIERCFIDHLEDLNIPNDSTDGLSDYEEEVWDQVDAPTTKYRTAENMKEEEFDLIVISRRSRHRAGTRYKRRGVNEKGHVANYVETEQIACVLKHVVSAVQVRGSVPVYWSQPGTKYRPLPLIDREFEESRIAFSKHFEQEFESYRKEIIVSLVELSGREKIIADSFLEHIFDLDSEKLAFVTFDFHEYCRGMKFENVSILINALDGFIRKSGFHWIDDSGLISQQECVFRVNCMDCLDRTNVVQASIARNMLLDILRKLGRLLPDEELPHTCRRIFNIVWANNGDAISRQYAGTAAMKGDFTRTGERKIAGMMKDGYNSANRYYLNRFKDNYRQTVIDMMLGNSITEDLSAIASAVKSAGEEEVWTTDKEECITQLVRHAELTLLPLDEESLGGWALVDPFSFVSPNEQPQDEDVILLLTHEAYYVARYNDELDEELSSYQRIPLNLLVKIEIGYEMNTFRNQYIFMRLHYGDGFFHTMRTIQNRSFEESKGILSSIAELFLSICRYQSLPLKIMESKLDKKRPRAASNVIPLTSKRTLSTSSRHKVHKEDKEKKLERRLSRSLSSLDSPTQERPLPDITVDGVSGAYTSDFDRFHQQYSPQGDKYDSEFVELRMTHSTSDTALATKQTQGSNTFSKMEGFFRKTKTALGTVGPKLRDISFNKDREPGEDSNGGNQGNQPASEAVKTTLKRINDKFATRAAEVKSKVIPEFKNRIQNALNSSPRAQRKKLLNEEEKERRRLCKTKILEL